MSGGELRMPDVGEGLAGAEIIQWLVQVGDHVAEDQPLVLVETDKSQVEIPSPASGTVTARHGAEGDVIDIGTLLVVIGDGTPAGETDAAASAPPAPARAPSTPAGAPSSAGGVSPAAAHSAPAAALPAPTSPAPGPAAPPQAPAGAPRHVLASPYTRRLAVQRGIDLSAVTGTGPYGRVQLADLDAQTPEPPSPPQPPGPPAPPSTPGPPARGARAGGPAAAAARGQDVVIPLRGLRRRIAQSMTQALRTPHILEFREVDATALLAFHAALKAELDREGARFSLLPLLMMATVRALRRHPGFNATFDPEREQITQYAAVHLGMATATEDGLIVPVLHDADRLAARDLAAAIDYAAERARSRQASTAELSGATFTVTNFGSYGAWLGTPIIRPPEVGIAGFGRITDKVLAVDGEARVRPVLPLVVAADHRVNDGAHLGAFVNDLVRAVTEPALLLL